MRTRRHRCPCRAPRHPLGVEPLEQRALLTVAIDWVTVGDAGNAPDSATGSLYGRVDYDYRIGMYEVTNDQYAAFLNAVARSDPHGLFFSNMGFDARGGITRSGETGGFSYTVKPHMGDKPVNFVNWFDAARFANWMHNGQPSGEQVAATTEDGAYTLNGATSGDAPARNGGARFSLPTENEWYKAAYYKGGGANAGYWTYATRSNALPTAVTAGPTGIGSAGGTGNSANYGSSADWNGQDGNVTTVGTNGGPSFYGTFDQTGNASEWVDLGGTEAFSSGLRGGCWVNFSFGMQSDIRFDFNPENHAGCVGFRLTSPVPPPNGAPTDIALSATSIAENAGADALVGTLTTTDPDAGDTFAYTLVAGPGDTDNASFTILGDQVRATPSFDFETKNSYSIRVRSTDQGGLAFERVFTITVTDVVEMQFVTVGDVGNGNDPATGGLYGAVFYQYRIGTYEVTIGQYTAFLNAVAADDPHGLYNPDMATDLNQAGISRAGEPGSYTYSVIAPAGVTPAGADSPADRPITYVSWFDAARFANWMHNGQGSGSTEIGAYTISTGAITAARRISNVNIYTLATPSTLSVGDQASVTGLGGTGFNMTGIVTDVWGSLFTMAFEGADATATGTGTMTGASPTASGGALYRLPTENEWYKAAYYSPTLNSGAGGYHAYATQSDTAPGNTIGDGANQANYRSNVSGTAVYSVTQSGSFQSDQNYLTNVGAFTNSASYYGTFDQSGNVWEWSEVIVSGPFRGLRGGSWNNFTSNVSSSGRGPGFPTNEYDVFGFRLASPLDPNHQAPADIALSATSIAENAGPNVLVGILSTTDPDGGEWYAYSYELVPGEGSSGNDAFAIVNNTLRARASFNYERTPSYEIRVRSTDAGGASVERSFTITVTDVNERPAIDHILPPADGSYRVGRPLVFTAVLTQPVTRVGRGTIDIGLGVGRATKPAVLVGGLGTNRLRFQYTPVRGDTDTDGVALGRTVRLARGVQLRDAQGRKLALAVPAVATRSVRVDTTAPVVRSLVAPAPGTYRPGRELLFTAVMSERVTVTGSPPTIAFSFGTARRLATYESGSGTKRLVFRYVVQPGDVARGGITIAGRLGLTGTKVRDAAGNAVVTNFRAPSGSRIILARPLVDPAV
jgi:sulfatase modifying factor 1